MKKLEVGDIIKITNPFMTYKSQIIRVTKTKAVGVTKNGDGSTFTTEFKREYNNSKYILPYRLEKWNMVERELITK